MKFSLHRSSIIAVVASVAVIGGATLATAAPFPESGSMAGGTEVTLSKPIGAFSAQNIATGRHHSLALDANGNIWAWGSNDYGQLGTGDTDTRITPTKITTTGDFTTIQSGANHSLALDTDGNIWAWGSNGYGQLGTSDTVSRNSPTKITTTGGFTTIAGGASHSLALNSAGSIWTWGSNDYGQLGVGSTIPNVASPTKITTTGDFTAVESGDSYSLALDADGNIWAWGNNDAGQLGTGDTATHPSPTKITTTGDFTTIAGGARHSFALDTVGDIWAWGYNDYGQLGTGDKDTHPFPTKITTTGGFTTVQSTYLNSFALDSAGDIWAWGNNSAGQLGTGDTSARITPTKITTDGGFTTIQSENYSSLALNTHVDGNAWAWGNNSAGQLGTGDATDRLVPTATLLDTTVTSITFDGMDGSNLTDNGDGTITVTTPAHAAGAVDVVVAWTANGITQNPIVYAGGYTYLDSTVTPPGTESGGSTVLATTGADPMLTGLIGAIAATLLLLGATLGTVKWGRPRH